MFCFISITIYPIGSLCPTLAPSKIHRKSRWKTTRTLLRFSGEVMKLLVSSVLVPREGPGTLETHRLEQSWWMEVYSIIFHPNMLNFRFWPSQMGKTMLNNVNRLVFGMSWSLLLFFDIHFIVVFCLFGHWFVVSFLYLSTCLSIGLCAV